MSRKRRPTDWSSPSVIAAQLRRLGFERYDEYLASDHWCDLRKRYRESDRPQRCACGAAGHQLHHLTYKRLGAELLTDIELVCADCHRRAHGIADKPKRKRKRPPSARRRKSPTLGPPGPLPRHLRPLGAAVEPPRPAPVKRPKSGVKRGEPKPWEWDAGRGAAPSKPRRRQRRAHRR